jgi:TonB-linked SusC/RagA family outer membrane protein
MSTDARLLSKLAALLMMVGVLLPGVASGQSLTITGTVTNAETGNPLPGVNILVQEFGAGVGAATTPDGSYEFQIPGRRVRGQSVTLVARFVGYRTAEKEVTLEGGAKEISFELQKDVLRLDQTVVTGSGTETRKGQVPYAVNTVSEEEVTSVAATTNPAEAIRGRVPGATVINTGGTPGTGPEIRLRGITSIDGDNSPLYVVDGAVIPGGMVDFSALNVENIEVIKGSAAAAIYGSRAQSGVVRITTKSGEDLGQGTSRIRFRNEFGATQLPDVNLQNQYHNSQVARTSFTDANGDQVQPGDWLNIEEGQLVKGSYAETTTDYAEWSRGREDASLVSFQDNQYPTYYDHVDEVFGTGTFVRNNLAFSHRSETTNFRLSVGNLNEQGPMLETKGFTRRNAQLRVEHDATESMTFSGNVYFSDSQRDDVIGKSGSYNPWPVLYFASPAVSMLQTDEQGEYMVTPDTTQRQENPLYTNNNVTWSKQRQRFVGTGQVEYRPLSWLTLEGLFSLKSFNGNQEVIYPKGFETSQDEGSLNEGALERQAQETRNWGANLKAIAAYRFLDGLNTRVQLKGRAERSVYDSFSADGAFFVTEGVPKFGNIKDDPEQEDITAESYRNDVRSLYGFLSTDIDWKGRYVLNALVRRDGSSLFGQDQRWNTYFRLGGAYRVAQEPWWPVSQVGELKLRYSYGTGGGQPVFGNKFQTYDVSGGRISKQQLGNPNLTPSYQIEQSIGLNFAVFNRISGSVTYATSKVEDQILDVPLPGYAGFNSQVRNAGTVESFSIEAQLNAAIIQQEDMTLTTGAVFSRSQSTITEWDRPSFRFGRGSSFLYEEGVSMGSIFGNYYLTSKSELPEQWQQYSDQFQVNDDGFLVPVGSGNSWKDGIEGRLWGTDVDIDGDGESDYDWGHPLAIRSDSILTQGQPSSRLIGDSQPAFSLGWNLDFELGGFSASMLWDMTYDFDVYNYDRHWAGTSHHTADQGGKPTFKKKPMSYENAFSNYNNRYAEDGSYVKLRELAIDYTFNQERLTSIFGASVGNSIQQITVGVTGNNLLTFTNYSGYDPEVSSTGNTKQRRDGLGDYPNYRRFTGKLTLTF